MNAFIQVLANPAIISLFIGVVAGLYTTLRFPSRFVDVVSIYLIFAIGFKGGACLGGADVCSAPLILIALIGITIGFFQPFVHYSILKKRTTLDQATAVVVAAEYGSISIVTFITALSFLNERGITYDAFMTAVAGMMEIPALFSGLWLLSRGSKSDGKKLLQKIGSICAAVLQCKKISVIFLGFFVGLVMRNFPTPTIDGLILWPFSIALVLFMIDIGMKVAGQKSAINQFKLPLLAFGIYMPLINGSIGLLIAYALTPLLGTQILFAILLASASYLAVPAVMRTQAPTAQEAVYLPLSLGVTLPFNIIIGLPLYYYLASTLQAIGS